MKMFACITPTGTPISDTVLCESCLADPIQERIHRREGGFVDCTDMDYAGREALICRVCGRRENAGFIKSD